MFSPEITGCPLCPWNHTRAQLGARLNLQGLSGSPPPPSCNGTGNPQGTEGLHRHFPSSTRTWSMCVLTRHLVRSHQPLSEPQPGEGKGGWRRYRAGLPRAGSSTSCQCFPRSILDHADRWLGVTNINPHNHQFHGHQKVNKAQGWVICSRP